MTLRAATTVAFLLFDLSVLSSLLLIAATVELEVLTLLKATLLLELLHLLQLAMTSAG
jgi:hypothetical protein